MRQQRINAFLVILLFFYHSTVIVAQENSQGKNTLKAVKILNTQKEVRRWEHLQPSSGANTCFLSLDKNEIVVRIDSEIQRLPLPNHFYNIVASRSGKYFAILQLFPDKKGENGNRQLHISVYSANARPAYAVNVPLYSRDIIPFCLLSDRDGALILGESPIGRLVFYTAEGQVERTVNLFPDAEFDLERFLQIALSSDGEKIAVLASKRGASPVDSDAPNPSGEPHLFLFNADGLERWNKPLPQSTPQNVAISPDGNSILAAGYSSFLDGRVEKSTQLLGKNNTLVKSFSLLFRTVDFSPQTNQILLADRSTIHQIDIRNGNVIREESFPSEEGLITSARFNSTGSQIFILTAQSRFESGRFIFQQPLLHILDTKGAQIQKLSFPDDDFFKPLLDVQNEQVFIGFAHHLYRIEVQQ